MAFDPISLALTASAVENACHPQRRPVPRVRLWLKHHARPITSALINESSDPALDAINHIDPHLGAVVLFIILLRCLMHIKFDNRQEPLWLCVAAYVHHMVVD
jgi:hypothetical protein